MSPAEPTPVILLVEDDKDAITLLRLALVKNGFHNKVIEARDGQEAIDLLQGVGKFANRSLYPLPQIILLDLKMPRLGGIDFLRWLRSSPEGNLLPVIVLTGSAINSDLIASYRAGANSYLVKSQDADELFSQVASLGNLWFSRHVRFPPP